jgi:hypothetical protein
MRRILVVANRTLVGDRLLDAIKARVAEGPCEFTLLVPAIASTRSGSVDSSAEGVTWRGMAGQAGDVLLPRREYARAQQRLEYGLDRLRQVGATVSGGEVASSNALNAIRDALRGREFDEIVISTLPSGVSRWLHQDLPHRVQRTFSLPVTVITAPRATSR